MVFTRFTIVMVAAVATIVDDVQAHGYVAEPAPTWKTNVSSEWVVEIKPLWEGDWEKTKGDEGLLSTFAELAPKNNYKDVRTLMDGNIAFGDDCGYTDPKGKPVDPPSNGAATFSRGIVHAGPCEIWLDDKMVLQNDDCQAAYGDGTKETIAVFKPVDYSSCAAGGCLFRFYWLALQRLNKKALWQAYKNCIPLTGPGGGGGNSDPTQQNPDEDPTQQNPNEDPTQQNPNEDPTQQNPNEDPTQNSPTTGNNDKDSSKSSSSDSDPAQQNPNEDPTQNSPTAGGDAKDSSTSPPSDTPEVFPAPAPSSKCKGARRRD